MSNSCYRILCLRIIHVFPPFSTANVYDFVGLVKALQLFLNNFKIMVMAKKMTIEDLAVMVNKGFAETATKGELRELRTEMHNGFKRVDQKIEALDFKIASVASSWNKDFERLHS